MAAFTVCVVVFAVWIVIQTKGWPKGFNLSLESHSADADSGSHGHGGDDGGGADGGGGDGGGD